MSVRGTLVRNTTFNAAGRIWEGMCNVVLTAYIVPRVGLSGWGLWALLGVFTGYVALLDFGMNSGLAKYIAEHAARDERDEVSAVVSTGFFFYLVFGVALVALGWICIDPLLAFIAHLSPQHAKTLAEAELFDEARFLLKWGLALFAVSNCIAAFTAIQTGLQRMGITNAISFGASLLKVGATVALLETGHGVRGLLYANALVMAYFAVAAVAAAFLLVPSLRVTPSRIGYGAFQRLFSFGWKSQVSRLSNLITFQTDKIIVGAVYIGLAPVGVYRIGEEAASKMRQAPALLVSALLPAASDLDARGEEERLQRLCLLASKYVAAATLPIVAFWVASSGVLMRTWMGSSVPDIEIAAWVNRILAFGYLANILPGAGVSIALGKGRPDVQMKAGIIAMVSNIGLTIALAIPLGIYGVALGTALSMALSCVWFVAAMRGVVGVAPGRLVRDSMLWPAVACIPGFLGCALVDALNADLVGRIPNGIVLLCCCAGFGLSYLAVIRYTPFLNAFDAEFLGHTLKLRYLPGFHAWCRRAASRV